MSAIDRARSTPIVTLKTRLTLPGPGVTVATTAKRRNRRVLGRRTLPPHVPQASRIRRLREPVSTNTMLSQAVERAFGGPLESPAADSLVVDLAGGVMLLMRRLDFTRERIRQERPVVEVACDAGSGDQAHFTRIFNAAVGLTPTRCRASTAARSVA
jgi:AraC-like DNA-binding protein